MDYWIDVFFRRVLMLKTLNLLEQTLCLIHLWVLLTVSIARLWSAVLTFLKVFYFEVCSMNSVVLAVLKQVSIWILGIFYWKKAFI